MGSRRAAACNEDRFFASIQSKTTEISRVLATWVIAFLVATHVPHCLSPQAVGEGLGLFRTRLGGLLLRMSRDGCRHGKHEAETEQGRGG